MSEAPRTIFAPLISRGNQGIWFSSKRSHGGYVLFSRTKRRRRRRGRGRRRRRRRRRRGRRRRRRRMDG